ncbi:MAG: hypothetical protein ACTHM9_05295 [Gemmatimonadales bacterium]|jgi:hypothetical protein
MAGYVALPARLLKSVVAYAAALTSLSCASSGWMPVSAPVPCVLPPTTRLQVWRSGHAVTLREASIEADSIRGLEVDPVNGPTGARLVLARADIDSLRQRPRDESNYFGAGVGAGALGIVVFWYLIQTIGPRGT